MLEEMARDAGVRFAATLTGFKWISRAASDGVLRFGYEEALGYAVDPLVADKDGMSAALAVCRLAHELAEKGKTLFDRLDELESRFGVHAGAQFSLRADGPSGLKAIRDTVNKVRAAPPSTLGAIAVTEVIDLAKGWNGLLPTDGLMLQLGESGRVVIRPSGTELKLKAYMEVKLAPGQEHSLSEQRAVGAEQLAAVRRDLEILLHF
jgi:phosphomannomutase